MFLGRPYNSTERGIFRTNPVTTLAIYLIVVLLKSLFCTFFLILGRNGFDWVLGFWARVLGVLGFYCGGSSFFFTHSGARVFYEVKVFVSQKFDAL